MAFAALSLVFSSVGVAASLDVNPVRIDIREPTEPAELRLTNTGADEISIQVDTRQWSQDADGADDLYFTDLLLAVPPLFTVPPGEQQIVRVGYLGAPSEDAETSFRILVTEIAPSVEQGKSGLNMRMQLSIPVFVAPVSREAIADIELDQVTETPDGATLILRNTGNAHAKLSGIELLGSSGWYQPPELERLARYLLPGSGAEVRVPANAGSIRAVRIRSADGRGWEHAVPPTR